jgi:hypothetical protein
MLKKLVDDPVPWRADASWTFVHKRFENSQSGAAPEKEKQRHIYSAVRTTKFLNKFQEYASPGTILVTNNINLSCFPKTQGKNVRLASGNQAEVGPRKSPVTNFARFDYGRLA